MCCELAKEGFCWDWGCEGFDRLLTGVKGERERERGRRGKKGDECQDLVVCVWNISLFVVVLLGGAVCICVTSVIEGFVGRDTGRGRNLSLLTRVVVVVVVVVGLLGKSCANLAVVCASSLSEGNSCLQWQ